MKKNVNPSTHSISWYNKAEHGVGRDETWRRAVGGEICELLGREERGGEGMLEEWPEGYSCFEHHTGVKAKERVDWYLFGSSTSRPISPQSLRANLAYTQARL